MFNAFRKILYDVLIVSLFSRYDHNIEMLSEDIDKNMEHVTHNLVDQTNILRQAKSHMRSKAQDDFFRHLRKH